MHGGSALRGKTAIVTGGGRGIGREVALAFAKEGAWVVVASRTPSEIEETAAMIRDIGQRSVAIPVDVSARYAVQDLVARTVHVCGSVHVLANAAGVQGPIGPAVENDPRDWERTIRINLVGTYLCCRAVLPVMMQQHHGGIINFSGGGATSPRPYFSAYAASKAAIVRFTENLAEEVREHGVRVNCVAPGAVNTRMLEEVLAAGEAAGGQALLQAQQQLETGGTPPSLVAALAVFLASDASKGLTGKLVSAPHDDWQNWDSERITSLMSAPWLTLRRMDPYTLKPLMGSLPDKSRQMATRDTSGFAARVGKRLVPVPLRVGVVGCGSIGGRRARSVRESDSAHLVMVADTIESKARKLAQETGCAPTTDWHHLVARDGIDAVIVSTVNKWLTPISVAALQNGKHVLCEKPPGRNWRETRRMVDAARASGRVLKVGFNHRHHPAISKAHELCIQGTVGPIMFIRAVYGHGGRPGYEKEWRGNAELAGGGELLDQGVHIVDLCRWFMGGFASAFGCTATHFWDLDCFPAEHEPTPGTSTQGGQDTCTYQGLAGNRQLEDNVFVLLRTADGRVAQWHTSWTQWKNRFSFEIFGQEGYLVVEGLGGSYGTETLTVGHRRPQSGPPTEELFHFPGPDLSWRAEWEEFVSAIREGRQPIANGEDGFRTMRVIAAIYESARTNQVVSL